MPPLELSSEHKKYILSFIGINNLYAGLMAFRKHHLEEIDKNLYVLLNDIDYKLPSPTTLKRLFGVQKDYHVSDKSDNKLLLRVIDGYVEYLKLVESKQQETKDILLKDIICKIDENISKQQLGIQIKDIVERLNPKIKLVFESSNLKIVLDLSDLFKDEEYIKSSGFGGVTKFTLIPNSKPPFVVALGYYLEHKESFNKAVLKKGTVEIPLNNLLQYVPEMYLKVFKNMTEEKVKEVVSDEYPDAIFQAFSHSSDFMPDGANLEKPFYHISLYDATLNSSFTLYKGNDILIIDNTYFSSFAYNLTLAWIHEFRSNRIDTQQINPLIKYNLKKFYGEHLYNINNNVFSRSVLLETLLYEHNIMIPLFSNDADEEWNATMEKIAGTMTWFVLAHEMGHYYSEIMPATLDELVNKNSVVLEPYLESVQRQYNNPLFIKEVICDVFALYATLMSCQDNKAERIFTLRSAIMCYSSLTIIESLIACAELTTSEHKKEPDQIDLETIIRPKREYEYYLQAGANERSREMLERAKLIIKLCEAVAQNEDIMLYGTDGILPMKQDILNYLLNYISQDNTDNNIMIENDFNQRSMAKMVAEAFHNHPEGMRYLYLNSKVYKSKRSLDL